MALRKILGSFRATPIGALKIESNIPPVKIWMHRKKHASQINRILNTMASQVNQINIENNEIWTKPWKEMKHWPELKIYRVKNLSIENLSIENLVNKLDKKLKNKNTG